MDAIDSNTNRRLLVFHPGAIGDIITVFPALDLLRNVFDTIDIVCRSQCGQLAVQLGVAGQSMDSDAALFAAFYSGDDCPQLERVVRRYGAFILFSRSDHAARWIGRRHRARIATLDPRPAGPAHRHITATHIHGFRRAGLLQDNTRTQPITPTACSLSRTVPVPERSGVIIHPGSGSAFKNWPTECFVTVSQMLQAREFDTVFIVGPAEQSIERCLLEQAPGRIHRPVRLTELAEMMSTAAGYIGNDSGVSHLAGYLGLPSVVLFGPSNPERWRPLGGRVAVLRSARDCPPCFERGQRACPHRQCMTETRPDEVASRLLALIEAENTAAYHRNTGPVPDTTTKHTWKGCHATEPESHRPNPIAFQ